jgi:AbrB family looped-hinge helix DNA binding protein
MYKAYTTVGQRGQITIPKEIRLKLNIGKKDRLLLKLHENNLIIEKTLNKKEKEKQMIEGYKVLTKINKETIDDFKYVDQENDDLIGDY